MHYGASAIVYVFLHLILLCVQTLTDMDNTRNATVAWLHHQANPRAVVAMETGPDPGPGSALTGATAGTPAAPGAPGCCRTHRAEYR